MTPSPIACLPTAVRRITWLTDAHLSAADDAARRACLDAIRAQEPDLLVVTGDLATGEDTLDGFRWLLASLPCPIAAVLGNHDVWDAGPIRQTRFEMQGLATGSRGRLVYLPYVPVLTLGPGSGVALVGHDGWADGRAGDFAQSPGRLLDHPTVRGQAEAYRAAGARLSDQQIAHLGERVRARQGVVEVYDYTRIHDFAAVDYVERPRVMVALAEESVTHLTAAVRTALERHDTVLIATHFPPFVEVARYEGGPSEDAALPHLINVSLGCALVALADSHPHRELVVLAGHTHHAAHAVIRPNLQVHVGGAATGRPMPQPVLWVDGGSVDPRAPMGQ